MHKASTKAAIVGILTTSNLFVAVYNGESKDYQNQSPVAAVTFAGGQTRTNEVASGGKVDDISDYRVRVYISYDDQGTAEARKDALLDVLQPLFMAKRRLGSAAGVIDANTSRASCGYILIRGTTYLYIDVMVHVWTQYTVTATD